MDPFLPPPGMMPGGPPPPGLGGDPGLPPGYPPLPPEVIAQLIAAMMQGGPSGPPPGQLPPVTPRHDWLPGPPPPGPFGNPLGAAMGLPPGISAAGLPLPPPPGAIPGLTAPAPGMMPPGMMPPGMMPPGGPGPGPMGPGGPGGMPPELLALLGGGGPGGPGPGGDQGPPMPGLPGKPEPPGMGPMGPSGPGGPGGPLGPPPDAGKQAMMELMSDPSFLARFKPEPRVKRVRKKWQRPAKPTPDQMRTKCEKDRGLLGGLVRRFDEDIARIRGESVGVFDSFDPDYDALFTTRAMADEEQIIASIIGTIEARWESPVWRPTDEDEAQGKEDFCRWLHEEHRRTHALAGMGDLDFEYTKSGIRYGRMITRDICNFEGDPGAAPFKMKLIDPSICYPTFAGDRGLVCVTLSYRTRLAELIGDFDQYAKEIEDKVHKGGNSRFTTTERYDWEDEVEVLEYWDPRWTGLFVAGQLIKGPDEHDYGAPPFIYTVCPYGDPGFAQSPVQQGHMDRRGYLLSSEQADLSRHGLSHFHTRFDPEAQRQAILGKLMTKLEMWMDEPIWYEVEYPEQSAVRPKWSRAPGARNEIPDGFRLVPGPDAPMPPTLGPLMGAVQEDVARSMLPPSSYGLTPSAQQSGYAIEGLSEQGRDKLSPLLVTKQLHMGLVAESRLQKYHDFGDVLGENGSRGKVFVPRSVPSKKGGSPLWEITPMMIERVGTRMNVVLTGTRLSSMGPMVQSLSMLRKEGIISRREFLKQVGLPGSRDPEQSIKEIDFEELRNMPEYKIKEMLKYVVEEEEDPMAADFILALIAKKGNQLGPGGGGGGGGGGQENGPAQMPGMSLPGLGQPSGREGGRPPGTGGIPANPAGGPPGAPGPGQLRAMGLPPGLEP